MPRLFSLSLSLSLSHTHTHTCTHAHYLTVTSQPYNSTPHTANIIILLYKSLVLVHTHTHKHTHTHTQVLACLQVDILHCKYRCILALGVELSVRLAASKQVKNAAERLKRTKEQTIYGSKSRKQLREEEDQAVCMCVCVCMCKCNWGSSCTKRMIKRCVCVYV